MNKSEFLAKHLCGNNKAVTKELFKHFEETSKPSGGSEVVKITYNELKTLRDEGKLVPGQQYRITDYQCTTAQENTRSAGHHFDIIVTADSESVLNENAKAIQHEGDFDGVYLEDGGYIEFYTGKKFTVVGKDITIEMYRWAIDIASTTIEATYSSKPFNEITGSTDKCFRWIESADIESWSWDDGIIVLKGNLSDTFVSAEEMDGNINITPYFANSNLAAWELKYCLDCDYSRFAWANTLKVITVLFGENPVDCIRDSSLDTIILDNVNVYGYKSLPNQYDAPVDFPVYFAHEITAVGSYDDLYDINGDIVDGPFTTEVVNISEVGTGVIYYMKDEWNNECPYDFKNIQFKRTLHHNYGYYDPDGEDAYVYTFNCNLRDGYTYTINDYSVIAPKVVDNNQTGICAKNIINRTINGFITEYSPKLILPDIVIISTWSQGNSPSIIFDNHFKASSVITFCDDTNETTIQGCYNVIFYDIVYNSILNHINDTTIDDMLGHTIIFNGNTIYPNQE